MKGKQTRFSVVKHYNCEERGQYYKSVHVLNVKEIYKIQMYKSSYCTNLYLFVIFFEIYFSI